MIVDGADKSSQKEPSGWTRDEWLGLRLGKSAWRVAPAEDSWREGLKTVKRDRGFAYARIPSASIALLAEMTGFGFRVVDMSVTLECPVEGLRITANESARFAYAGDRIAVTQLARQNFHFSRFHLDPGISRDVANQTRADWVDGFFDGKRGSHLVLADVRGVAGFLLLLGPVENTLTIDLIAVDTGMRGQGLASAMIGFAAHAVAGTRALRVGTQAANIPSLRLYEGLGFRVVKTDYVVHLHWE